MTRLANSMSSGLANSAPIRAPASACALDRVRRIASVEKRASQRGQARRARPLDVGLVDHDDGLAVERPAQILQGGGIEQIRGRIVRRAQIHELDVRPPGRQQPLGIERPALLALEGHLDDVGALNARGNLVHAEARACIAEWRRCRRAGKCATTDRWLRRCRASRARSPPERRRARPAARSSAFGLRLRIAIEARGGGVAGGPPGRFVGVQTGECGAAKPRAHRP